ncbi:MAG: lysophospholipid acyltransferase family protein [candidate division FCPU426 bacterium]
MAQKLKNTVIYWALRGVLLMVGILPWRAALALGAALGSAFHAAVRKERERARTHLALAYPGQSPQERQALARRVFVALGRNALELFKMMAYPPARIAGLVETVEGREHMEAAWRRRRGVLCLTGHLGNWEILPVWTQQQGWDTAVVAQTLYDPRLDALLNGFRERGGIRVIKRQGATREILRCLHAGMLLGVLNDQDTDVDSQWADFFGRPAKTPVGIFRLARKLGAAVVPITISRQPNGRHRIVIEPELQLPHSADEDLDLAEGARLGNAFLERSIRRSPEQWVWFHQRWKSPAPASGGTAC